jgi:formyl-CoA transferase
MTDAALGDLRVVEMGQLLAGPFCGQLLGDFGAEVVKIEPPGAGDPMREWGREKPHGMSLWWPILARNKKSVTLNLRTPEGQALARKVIAQADVLVENFRPGTLERWGLAPADLQRENPRLIITRVTGYGQDGPYAPRAGFGSIGEAMGGIRYVTGDPDKPPSRAGSRSATSWPARSPRSAPSSRCTPGTGRDAARSSTPPSTRRCSR